MKVGCLVILVIYTRVHLVRGVGMMRMEVNHNIMEIKS